MLKNNVEVDVKVKCIEGGCGTAGFLISCAEYIREHYERKMSDEQWKYYQTDLFTGYDKDATMCYWIQLLDLQ